MNNITEVTSGFQRTLRLAVSLLVIMFSWPAHASINSFITEYHFAFISGMAISVILLLSLFKSFAPIRIRYPLIISSALLVQLYILDSIESSQIGGFLISAGAFVSAIFIASVAEKLTRKLQAIFVISSSVSLVIFSGAVLLYSRLDATLLWGVYFAVNVILAGIGLILLKQYRVIHIGREMLLSFFVIIYGSVIYLWLTNIVADYWLIINAITMYLWFMIYYCKGVIKQSAGQDNNVINHAAQIQPKLEQNNSIFDPITNLPNYHHSLNYLRHYNNNDPSALVIIVFKAIDFSQVNKVLGHHNADILLLQLAYSLQKKLVDNELLVNFNQPQSPVRLARLQGLDFVVALDANASHHPVKILVEQLCQQLRDATPNAISFKSFSLNFSLKFGVAFVSQHHNDLEKTIAFAGDALLEAENNYQSVSYYNQKTAIFTEQKLVLMEKLKRDIVDNKLTWLLQPQISLTENRLIGFEILTDWRSTNGHTLDIEAFIEIAEYSGEIYRLTRQIIEQACQLIAILHQDNFHIQVSVNLSSRDVLEHDLIEYIEKMSGKYHFALRYLVLELDESLLFTASDKTKLIIDQLKSMGVKVSINNFSGSYEALRYLRRLAIDQVKVDCSQLLDATQVDYSEKTIISALINLIRKMKIPLIATGINNNDIKHTYIDIGGDIGQGNLITEGLKLTDAKAWTAQWLKSHVEVNKREN